MDANWAEMWKSYYDEERQYGEYLCKRSIGELPEKNASKSFALLLKDGIYRKGDSVIDIGCATGHFLRSFRDHLDPEIAFTGVDFNPYYIELAKKAYGDTAHFVVGDAFSLEFDDKAFDISVINLFHHFDDPVPALSEALRVSRRYCVWRTPMADVTHLVKVLKGETDAKPKSERFYLFNLYSEKFILEHLAGIGIDKSQVRFIVDELNDEYSNRELFDGSASKSTGNLQLVGNLVAK